jgi:hypothetical protein
LEYKNRPVQIRPEPADSNTNRYRFTDSDCYRDCYCHGNGDSDCYGYDNADGDGDTLCGWCGELHECSADHN